MGFSRVAALHLFPLLVRITLCAVFVPAGWSKIMNRAEFSGPAAATIRTLTGASTADAKPVVLGQELSPPSDAARAESEAPLEARRLYGLAVLLHDHELPYPVVQAWLAAITELVGGGLLLIGFFSRIWAVGLSVAMGFAFALTTLPILETVSPLDLDVPTFTKAAAQVALFTLSLGIVLTGPGGLSIDHAVFGAAARPASEEEDPRPHDPEDDEV
ncbi:MAG: DoxX family membrane protein [Phycisphaeraceae bacterium]|nr:DoxX family membrane protein [Phycisphaeraceae bacterium]